MSNANMLNQANNYKQARYWTKAIEQYEIYMEHEKEHIEDKVYADYAECLRRIGKTTEAESELLKAAKSFPKSEKVLHELFKLYDFLGKWKEAREVSENLIQLNSKASNYYFLLGRALAFSDLYDEAKEAYKNGLESRHRILMTELIENIQKKINSNLEGISSKYILTSGRNNLGLFIHDVNNKKYLTKISRYSARDSKREEAFYKNISRKYPILDEVVPHYIDSQVINNILYLTTNMIEDKPITSDHLNDVIMASEKITTIKSKEIIKDYPNPKYLFQLKNRPIAVVIFFTKIHKKNTNTHLFTLLYRLLKQHNYPESIIQIVKDIEMLIMDNYLYAFIDPNKHYSLLHGDFIPSNIKMDKNDGKIKVFDWATFTTGPRFIDIARYLTARLIPYEEIKKVYLTNEESGGKLSLIEEIFFHYALILLYILRLREEKVESRLEDCILPSLKELKKLVKQINNNDYKEIVHKIKDREEKVINKIEQLENESENLKKQINKIKKDNRRMQKRHENMLNSKSWKITKPLRKFVERDKRK